MMIAVRELVRPPGRAPGESLNSCLWLLQVRELVHDFYASRYASCLKQLQRLQPTLNLDMHLHQHAAALSSAVSSADETGSPLCSEFSESDGSCAPLRTRPLL